MGSDPPKNRRVRERQVDLAACDLLRREAETLVNRLDGADIRVEGTLPPAALARSLRDAYDPYGRPGRARVAASAIPNGVGSTDHAWPLGAEEAWSHYQSDSAMHVTYWIAAWPRVEVGADLLPRQELGEKAAALVDGRVGAGDRSPHVLRRLGGAGLPGRALDRIPDVGQDAGDGESVTPSPSRLQPRIQIHAATPSPGRGMVTLRVRPAALRSPPDTACR